jgi:hypothetical protein
VIARPDCGSPVVFCVLLVDGDRLLILALLAIGVGEERAKIDEALVQLLERRVSAMASS